MRTPRETDGGLAIDQVAKLTGVLAATLRVWELRFGWPRPGRLPNGYRVFPLYMVDQITRVHALHQAGHLLKDIIIDGIPRWPADAAHPEPITWTRFAQLPAAIGADAIAFRVDLDLALHERRDADVHLALHSAPIVLRPRDRMVAAWLPAYFGAKEWARNGRPFRKDVGATIGRVAGAAVLADVIARWETAEAIG